MDSSAASAADAYESEDGYNGLNPPRQVPPPPQPRTAFFVVFFCHDEAYSCVSTLTAGSADRIFSSPAASCILGHMDLNSTPQIASDDICVNPYRDSAGYVYGAS